jgi:hypothetical protein
LAHLKTAIVHFKTLQPKMPPKAAIEAKAIKMPWVEDVGPKMRFYAATEAEATISFWVDGVRNICFMK